MPDPRPYGAFKGSGGSCARRARGGIPNSGHTINLEEPDLFNRALLDFLTAVDSGSWPTRSA